MCTCVCVGVYVCMCVGVYMCTCVCVYVCTCVSVHVCTCMYLCVYMCGYVWVCLCASFPFQLVNFLYTKPDRGLELSVWLRAIFMCHTAYLTTVTLRGEATSLLNCHIPLPTPPQIPQVVDSLNGLYQLLDTRVSTFGKLCHLQGKLDLMMSQVCL